MRELKLNIGDKVRVLSDSDHLREVGEIGTIIDVDNSLIPYLVDFESFDEDGEINAWFFADELELVK